MLDADPATVPPPFGTLAELVPRRLAEGVVTRILEGVELTLVYVELEPWSAVLQHSHVNEQIGFLISGSIEFRVGDELRVQTAGETWIIPPGMSHGIDRTGPEGATLVEAFAPARVDFRELPRLPVRALHGPLGGEDAHAGARATKRRSEA